MDKIRKSEESKGIDHILADNLLHESQKQALLIADLLEKSGQLFAVSNADGSLGIFNPAFLELTGYSADELRGINWTSVPLTTPEWFESESKALAELDSTGKPVRYQKDMVRKDGTRISIELWANILRDEAGKQKYRYAFITDITERKRSEEALRSSRQIMERILNAIPVRVFWKDKNLKYFGSNSVFARDAGLTDPKDIIGKDDYQLNWRDQADLYRNDDLEVMNTGHSKLLIEEPQTTPTGKTITLLTNKMPLLDADGKIIGVLGTYMDIIEHKRAEDALNSISAHQETILAAVPDIIMEVDMNKIHTWANKMGLEFFGEEVIGKAAAYYFEGEQETYKIVQPVFNGV